MRSSNFSRSVDYIDLGLYGQQ